MYCDVKILIYPKRGVYVAHDKRTEDYQLLKVLLGTLWAEDMRVLKKTSRTPRVLHRDAECVVEISLPNANFNNADELTMRAMLLRLSEVESDVSWECACVPHTDSRKATHHKSHGVLNPLLRLKTTIEVDL
jgi:hypothetical protein